MVEREVSSLASVEIMRRLVARLPDNSPEQVQLLGVIKGLSTAGFLGQPVQGKRWEAGAEGRARQVLVAILPKLAEQLPDNPLVAELAKRYGAQGAKA
jgi:hypothetical protein